MSCVQKNESDWGKEVQSKDSCRMAKVESGAEQYLKSM